MSEAELGAGERLDRIHAGLRVIHRRKGHRSGSDDVLLAWAGMRAAPEARRVLDLGTGHGTVALLLAHALPKAELVGVEAQAVSAALARRNVALNGLLDRLRIEEGDMRAASLPSECDLVTGAPPFMPVGSGTMPQDPQRAAARFELRGGVEAYTEAAARSLAPNGQAVFLMDGQNEARTRAAFADAQLFLRRVTYVVPRPEQAPVYMIFEGGRSPTTEINVETLPMRLGAEDWSPAYASARATLGFD